MFGRTSCVLSLTLSLLLLLKGGECVVPNTPGFSVSEAANYTLLATSNSSSLYSLALQQDDYQVQSLCLTVTIIIIIIIIIL